MNILRVALSVLLFYIVLAHAFQEPVREATEPIPISGMEALANPRSPLW